MRLTTLLRTSTAIASTALLGLALSVGAPTAAMADKVIPMPSGLCAWNYGASTTDVLFSRLAARDDFGPSMSYVTNTCPTSLCQADWTGDGAKAVIGLLAEGEYFGQLVGTLGQTCPDVALLLTDGATASTIDYPAVDHADGNGPGVFVQPSDDNGTDDNGTDDDDATDDDGDQGNHNGNTDNPGNHYGRDGNPGKHLGRDGNPGNHYGQVDNPGNHYGQVGKPEEEAD